MKETGGLESVVCGTQPDGTEILCGSTYGSYGMAYAAPNFNLKGSLHKSKALKPFYKSTIIGLVVFMLLIIIAIVYLKS
jgi:hypothetical protein